MLCDELGKVVGDVLLMKKPFRPEELLAALATPEPARA
jgi:hypothetical protein